MNCSGGLGEMVFGMKGRGQCIDPSIHSSEPKTYLPDLSLKQQGMRQAEALHHSEGSIDGKRGISKRPCPCTSRP